MTRSPTLTGLTWDDPRGYGPLHPATSAFAASVEEPVTIQWDIQPLSGFESRSVEELTRLYDMLVLDHPHVTSASQAGALVPITNLDECYVGCTLESYQWDGAQWAVPIDAACHVTAYREDAATTLPRTWDELILAGDEIRVALPLAGVHSLMALLTLTASQGVSMSDPIAWIDSSATARSLRLLKRLCQGKAAQGLDWNPIQALEALADGLCDYVPLTFGYAHWQQRNVRFSPIPSWDEKHESRAVLGGAGMAVSAHSDQQELAMRFAKFCGNARVQSELWAGEGGQPAHSMAWDALGKTNPFYRDTRECIQSAFLRPRHLAWNQFQSQAGSAIEKWLRLPTSSSEEVIGDLQTMWKEDAACAT